MKTKKILATLLSSAMVLGAIAVPAFAEDEITTLEALNNAITSAGATATTIKLDSDISIGNFETKAITVGETQNITLDLNGHAITGTATNKGTAAMIINNGILTINDSANSVMPDINVTTGADARNILDNYTGAKILFYAGDPDEDYGYGQNTITNNGNLTINGGLIAAKQTEAGIVYAIDNYATSTGTTTCTVNGGEIYNWAMAAVRCTSFIQNKAATLNVTGGIIKGYGSVALDLQVNNVVPTVNVSGGSILANNTSNPYYAIHTSRHAGCTEGYGAKLNITGGNIGEVGIWSAQNAATEISISGGTLNGFEVSRGSAVTINDGTLSGFDVYNCNNVAIKGGNISFVPYTEYTSNDQTYSYSGIEDLSYNTNVSITGGIFDEDVQDYMPEGYAEKEENGTYTVIPFKQLMSNVADSVTVKTATNEIAKTYEQVTAATVAISDISSSYTKEFTVTATDASGNAIEDINNKSIALNGITLGTEFSGGGSVLCGIIITDIPEGYTVTVE